MSLSNDLISQFVKATKDDKRTNKDSVAYGTVVEQGGTLYVKLDGSDLLTPMSSTITAQPGERVTVMIKGHSVTSTGNISSPAVRTGDFQQMSTVVASKVSTEDLEAVTARVGTLEAGSATIDDLEAATARIDDLETNSLTAEAADLKYAEIEDLEASNARIYNLETTYVSTQVLDAEKARITDLEANAATIDFANIDYAAVQKIFADSGIIHDLVVSNNRITGELVGVTISGDLIQGNTVKADKLVVLGEDGIYYKLNVNGLNEITTEKASDVTLTTSKPSDWETNYTDYYILDDDTYVHVTGTTAPTWTANTYYKLASKFNSGLDGSNIVAKSIVAEKIAVDDLVAFGADIAGFHIRDNTYVNDVKTQNGAIYSGVKASVDNSTRGIYLDNEGQMAIGDGTNFLKYYKDQNGVYRLAISAGSIVLSSSNKNIETVLNEKPNSLRVEYAISTSSSTAPVAGWSTTTPPWENGKYMWQRIVAVYPSGEVPGTPTCITGATGATGAAGSAGATGTGVSSIVAQFYLSSSKTTQSGGSWVGTMPTWSTGMYLWTRSKITYSNPTSIVYTTPICDSSWEAVNDIKVGGRNLISRGKGDTPEGFFKNFAKVEEGYGEHTLTSKNTYAGVSIADGFLVKIRDYTVGETLTMSYDIMYTVWDFPTGTTRSEFWMGQRYSGPANGATTGAWRGVTQHNLPVVGVNGCQLNEWYHVEKTLVVPAQAATGIGEQATIQLYNNNPDVSASITFKIKNVKLERGNKATDWTPAPEDVQANIDSVASIILDEDNGILSLVQSHDNTLNTLSNNLTALSAAFNDSIQNLIVGSGGASLLTQVDGHWQFNMSTYEDAISNVQDILTRLQNGDTNTTITDLKAALDKLSGTSEWVRVGTYVDGTGNTRPCIRLGEADSAFQLMITNTEMKFMGEGDTVLAYFTSQSFNSDNIIVDETLQFTTPSNGIFMWSVRQNGNFGLSFKGGSS